MKPIGVYIHWPYCARICPYCDFNVYKDDPAQEQNLVAAILDSLKYWRQKSGPRALASVHFGGGTPSLMAPDNMAKIIDLAVQLWTPASDLEVGLEANPNDISLAKLQEWRRAGIERLSVGVQSFDDAVLGFLGRDHKGAGSHIALEQATSVMARVSADLIYGWRGQSVTHWQDELVSALRLGLNHISTYQLTIEEKTAFARAQSRGDVKTVDDDMSADLYEAGQQVLQGAGFQYYEISNAACLKSHRSRHNLIYWQGLDYVGVGPGAHGRLTRDGQRFATLAPLKPAGYMARSAQEKYPFSPQTALSPQAWAQEYVLMGLRISDGISLTRYEKLCAQKLAPEPIAQFVADGLLSLCGDTIAATAAGRLVLDRLSHELLNGP